MKRLYGIIAGLCVIALTAFGCASMPGQSDTGWITLLDGAKGVDNWDRVGSSNWALVEGIMQADKKAGKENGFLVSKKSFSNFQLRVEFWATSDANSGIFMRCQNPKVITDKSCYEANVYDQRPDPSFGTGGIVHHAKIIGPMQKAGGKWNVYEITAKGPNLVVVLNGTKTSELNHSQFTSGPIALQHGAGVVKFRKVQIKPL